MSTRAQDYVRWLRRRALAVLAGTALVSLACGYLAIFKLPLKADFATLLPEDAQSVRDLRRLEKRLAADEGEES